MADIDLSEVSDLGTQRDQQERAAQELAAGEQAKFAEIKQRIIDGETTGVELHDLLIVRTGRLNPEHVELYRDLSARVAAHVGEPVLLVGNREERMSYGGPGARESGTVATNHVLSVIESESLVLDIPDGDWSFPTSRYAIDDGFRRRDPDRLVDDPLRTGVAVGYGYRGSLGSPYESYLGRKLEFQYETRPFADEESIALEVFIGDAEITEWIDRDLTGLFGHNQARVREYNELAELLELPRKKVLSDDEFRRASDAAHERRPTDA